MSDLAGLRQAQASIVASGAGRSAEGLCRPCLDVLPVDGAAVSLLSGTARQQTLCASDQVAQRIDELQFDLGEGPCWQALDTGRAVLVPDVRGGSHPSWPHFGAAARDCGAAAIFAFPMRARGVALGALDLYRARSGPLDPDAVRAATSLAGTLAEVVLRRVLEGGGPDDVGRYEDTQGTVRREVHQAVGMVLAQVGTDTAGAFALLRARAFAENRSVTAVALDVLARRITFA